ncbi:MAG: hypothetical protein ABIT38_19310 [Gemmatimonadaceae bacterium]
MIVFRRAAVTASFLALVACTSASSAARSDVAVAPAASGTLAQIYYWRAKPGKFDEYSHYIRDIAEPIDHDAQRRGAFLSVTTYVVQDTLNPWSHMRVFILRDSAQLRRLGTELDSAGIRLEPDSVKRRTRGEYSASLRDRVGAATGELLR